MGEGMLGGNRSGHGVSPLRLVRKALTGPSAAGWSLRVEGQWCVVWPADHGWRAQGWKLHLSATPASARTLLERALPVLLSHHCAFKVAAEIEHVAWLNSGRCPRAAAGKFLTVYPDDDDQFRRLADALDRATAGLVGPRILSDGQYRPDSVVHYRFGGFVESVVLDDDGCYRTVITDPWGHTVEDRREAWFAPARWVTPVLTDQPSPPPAAAPRPVLLGDRFLVTEALRRTGRGGTYLGIDRRTGARVAVKQARAYMEIEPSGRDCRDRLRHEAEMLGELAPRGLAPRLIGLVDQGRDLFLVREPVDGCTLRRWVARQLDSGGVPLDAGLAMARALVRLLDSVHGCGLVLVDVSPNNIMVDQAGRLWLTDLDHCAVAGEVILPAGTPGYTPPEHLTGAAVPARAEADLFGLGALLFLVAVGCDPVLLGDERTARSRQNRLRERLDLAGDDFPLIDRCAEAVIGLMHERPEERWRTEWVLRCLDGTELRLVHEERRVPDAERHRSVDRLVEDGVAYLLATMTPDGRRLWPSGRFGAGTDCCAVQHGAAGVLGTLVRATRWVGEPDRVRGAVAGACRWIEKRLSDGQRLLPGLFYGRSGTAWALYDAAELLADRRLATVAVDLAGRVPVVWPNPDVAHGAAGAGMVQLYLWRASGDERLAARVEECADALLAAAEGGRDRVFWPIPATLSSRLAGGTFYGYAHGTAGIGAFLLAAGTALGRGAYHELAVRAADTLASTAQYRDGAALWPVGPAAGADTPGGGDAGWCNGSAGIGTFLLHAWRVTGRGRYLDAARAAGLAVYRSRLRATTAGCHGLAGGGHYLLDLAEVLGEPTYREWAWDLARVLEVRSARRDGRLLVPDETGLDVVADYAVGLAGVVDFLVRLRHGGRRPWSTDCLDVRAEPALPAGDGLRDGLEEQLEDLEETA